MHFISHANLFRFFFGLKHFLCQTIFFTRPILAASNLLTDRPAGRPVNHAPHRDLYAIAATVHPALPPAALLNMVALNACLHQRVMAAAVPAEAEGTPPPLAGGVGGGDPPSSPKTPEIPFTPHPGWGGGWGSWSARFPFPRGRPSCGGS